jgi:hypothetical protein
VYRYVSETPLIYLGQLQFEGFPDFLPNLTPKEVLHAGSFGGTYFRNI